MKFKIGTSIIVVSLCLVVSQRLMAGAECNDVFDICKGTTGSSGGGSGSSSKPAYPNKSSSVNVNPSAVPIEKGFGIEAIHFKSSDFLLVRGLGRIGAAISPSNSEETFFGPPAFELPSELELRRKDRNKYPSQKFSLAGAANLYKNGRTGLKRVELNLGALARFNTISKSIRPGGGLSGTAGPLTFGYSVYQDETQLDYTPYGIAEKPKTVYHVETYSAGLFLNAVALDYSVLRTISNEISTVIVMTGTLLLRKSIFTYSVRKEDSRRPAYDFVKKTLVNERIKNETFAGFQHAVTGHLHLGVFYNYYVMRELSVGATLFF